MKFNMLADTAMPQYLPEKVPRAQPWCLNKRRDEQYGRVGTKKSKNIRHKMKKTIARNQKSYIALWKESKSGLAIAWSHEMSTAVACGDQRYDMTKTMGK
jgi:hypothetical protein